MSDEITIGQVELPATEPVQDNITIGEIQPPAEAGLTIGEVELPAAAPEEKFSFGKAMNSALETVMPAIGKAMNVAGDIGAGVERLVTGQTADEQKTAELTEQQARMVKLPEIPGAENKQKYLPGYKERIVNRDIIEGLRKEAAEGKLTATGKERLAMMEAEDAKWQRFDPLPKAPTERNSGIGGATGMITDAEIGAIANQYGVDAGVLMNAASSYGGQVEGGSESTAGSIADKAKELVGFLDAAGGDIGKWAGRKLWNTPQEQRAIEDMRAIIQQRQSKVRTVGELAGGIVTGLGTTKMLTSAANAAAKTGQAAKATLIGLDVADTAAQMAAATIANGNYGDSVGRSLGSGAILMTPIAISTAPQALKQLPALLKAKKTVIMEATPSMYEAAAATGIKQAEREAPELLQVLDMPDAKEFAKEISANEAMDINTIPGIREAIPLAKRMGSNATSLEGALEYLSIKNKQEPRLIQDEMTHMLTERAHATELATRQEQTVGSNFLARMGDWLSSAPMSAAIYDKKHGTHVAQTLDAMSTDSMLAAAVSDEFAVKLDAIRQKLEKLKPQGTEDKAFLNDVFTSVDNGAAVTPELTEVVGDFKDFFKLARQFYSQTGQVQVAELMDTMGNKLGYVPHRMLSGVERAIALNKKAKEVGLLGALSQGMETKTDPALVSKMRETGIADVLAMMEGKVGISDDEIVPLFKKFADMNRSGDGVDEAVANIRSISALQKRGGKMPEWIMDRNPLSASMGYIHDLSQMVYLEPHIRELKHFQNIAKRVDPIGNKFDANMDSFLGRMLDDLAGGGQKQYVSAAIRNQSNRAKKAMLLASEAAPQGSVKRQVYKALAEAPDGIMQHIRKIMYGGFLGAQNVKAPLQNLAQPLLSGIPEIGNVYGAAVLARALPRATLAPIGHGPAVLSRTTRAERLQAAAFRSAGLGGYLSTELGDEMHRLMRGELKGQGLTSKAIDTANNLNLALFSISERFSRALTAEMGAAVANDVIAGKQAAMNFIEGMKGSYGNSVKRALQRGDEEGVRKLISNYIMARVALNYDKAAQSNFTRMMGPIFSSFTRWPSEGLGRINYALRAGGPKEVSKEALRGVRSHGPILALLFLADSMVHDPQAEGKAFEHNSRAKTLAGAKGLKGWSLPYAMWEPAATVLGFNKEGASSLYTPPALEVLTNVGKGAVNKLTAGEDDQRAIDAANRQLARAADAAFQMTVPLVPSAIELSQRTLKNLVGRDEPIESGVFSRMVKESQ